MRLSHWYYITLRSLFLFLVVLTLNGGVVYWLWNMSPPAAALVFLLSAVECAMFIKWSPGVVVPDETVETWKFSLAGVVTNVACSGLGAVLVWYLMRHAGDAAVRTPWAAVDWKFFALYFVMLAVGLWGSVKKYLHPFGVSMVLFVTFSVVLFLLPHGFGFDTHVHHATEKIIAQEGVIEPKQLYYNGHYALVVILQKLIIPWNPHAVTLIDTFLVPLMAALIIPLIIALRIHKNALLPPLIGLFVVTTPQSYSYILFLALAMVVWSTRENNRIRKQDGIWMCVLALAACTVHPLTGIPALGLVALRFLAGRGRAAFLFICAALVVAVPLLFLINEHTHTGAFPNAFELWQRAQTATFPFSNADIDRLGHNYFTLWAGIIYAVQLVMWPLFFIGVFGVWRRAATTPAGNLPLTFAFSMTLSALCMYLFTKPALVIDYEQANYAGRLLVLGALALTPLFFEFVGAVVAVMRQMSKVALVVTLVVLAGYGTCVLYLSYPRVDRAVSTHAYSTRTADYQTIEAIEIDAGTIPYAVLANQQVSAAALDLIGFASPRTQTYFKTIEGESYFYPVPTGGKLYQFYLSMVNDGVSKKTAATAMDFMGVNRLYVVINDYWWKSKELVAQARALGVREVSPPNAPDKVFVFER